MPKNKKSSPVGTPSWAWGMHCFWTINLAYGKLELPLVFMRQSVYSNRCFFGALHFNSISIFGILAISCSSFADLKGICMAESARGDPQKIRKQKILALLKVSKQPDDVKKLRWWL